MIAWCLGFIQCRVTTRAEKQCVIDNNTLTCALASFRLESMTTLAAGRRRFFCSAMPYVECTQLRYHCTKVPGVDLCPQAYAEGRFPPGCSAADFVRLEGGADAGAPGSRGGASGSSAAGTANNGWTPQETLL